MNYITLLHSALEVRNPPRNLNPNDEHLFCHEFTKLIDPCISILFHDIHVLGGSFFSTELGFIDPFFPGTALVRRFKSRLLDVPSMASPRLNINTAIFPSPSFGVGYFHWFSDYLPIIQAASDAFDHCNTIILPERAKRLEFVHKSLQNFNLNILWAQRFNHLKVHNLYIIGPVAQSGNYRTNLFMKTLLTVQNSFDTISSNIESSELIYVSRRDAQRRFLANEEDVSAAIIGVGGLVITLEGLSLQEQYSLFSKCKLIIGLHGAGLTNMIWMSSGSSVLEIRNNGDAANNCYFSMASVLGHKYYYSQAKSIGMPEDTYSAILIADIDHILFTINEAII